jgi:hypothetical protein
MFLPNVVTEGKVLGERRILRKRGDKCQEVKKFFVVHSLLYPPATLHLGFFTLPPPSCKKYFCV